MSQAPDVTDPDQIHSSPGNAWVDWFEKDPAVVVMEWTPDLRGLRPSSSDDDLLGYNSEAVAEHVAKYLEWLNQLQRHLAVAWYVIVHNWFPNVQTNWDVRSVSKFKHCMDQEVQVQGKSNPWIHRRLLPVSSLDAGLQAAQYHLTMEQQDKCSRFHWTLSLRKFVEEGINNPSTCGNCLDSPSLRAEVSPFIVWVVVYYFFICDLLTSTSDIADCTHAYELTRNDNTVKLPLCVSKDAATKMQMLHEQSNHIFTLQISRVII